MTDSGDEAAIRGLVEQLVEGWNAGDGAAYARPFAADADFTNILGFKAHGRDLIARGHAEILSTIYKGIRVAATVEGIRFLRPDVAVADVALEYSEGSPTRRASAGLVATKEADGWSIAVFRNMVPFARPMAGPLDRGLGTAAKLG
jgi:uncharacterized protein (TIGR02246 family)